MNFQAIEPHQTLRFTIVLAVIIGSTDLVCAQSSRSPAAAGRRIDEINRQVEKIQRDELSRELSVKADPEARKKALVLRSHIKEDLELLQQHYNKLVLSLQLGERIQEAAIDASLDVIHKHSVRLRDNLSLPKPMPSVDETPIQPSVTLLCKRLHFFLTSSVLETPTVLEPTEAVKAAAALDDIIILSKQLGTGK